MQKWYKNEWIITIGSGVVLLIISSVWDINSESGFTNAARWLFNLEIKLGWLITTIFPTILLILLFRRQYVGKTIYEPLFLEGTQVILKTNVKPIMVTSEFNKRTNEVLCSWAIDSEIKKERINQNLLKVYDPPIALPISGGRSSNFWRH